MPMFANLRGQGVSEMSPSAIFEMIRILNEGIFFSKNKYSIGRKS